ncbi:MAG: hypothetical protein F6J92_36640 [Symploca sp. SIO1A3]|nr:hypothetical protein [Symploca sp. SIO1A3]
MSEYFMKVSGDTKVLAGSTSGFTQENQCSDSNQKFDIDPNGSFDTIKCLNNKYWQYFPSTGEVKLVFMASPGNDGKFQVKSNGSDYEVFCKAVNNGTTRIAIAGAYEFDLQSV